MQLVLCKLTNRAARRVAPLVDIVLISHHDMAAIGGLPYAVKHVRTGSAQWNPVEHLQFHRSLACEPPSFAQALRMRWDRCGLLAAATCCAKPPH